VADDLVIGTIVGIEDHPGARAPSLLLTVDLGNHGMQEIVLSTGAYDVADLQGAQVVCRREADGTVVVSAHSHRKGLVLLRPDQDVEPGTLVS
jgi:tRNA-binding EMAP/Myf-like protein